MEKAPIKQGALHYLYKQLKNAKISLGQAENRNNNMEERMNLQSKIDILDWVIGVVIKEKEE